jgi:hypothetical protein
VCLFGRQPPPIHNSRRKPCSACYPLPQTKIKRKPSLSLCNQLQYTNSQKRMHHLIHLPTKSQFLNILSIIQVIHSIPLTVGMVNIKIFNWLLQFSWHPSLFDLMRRHGSVSPGDVFITESPKSKARIVEPIDLLRKTWADRKRDGNAGRLLSNLMTEYNWYIYSGICPTSRHCHMANTLPYRITITSFTKPHRHILSWPHIVIFYRLASIVTFFAKKPIRKCR